MKYFLLLLTVLLLCVGSIVCARGGVRVQELEDSLRLQTDFLALTVNTATLSIDFLSADFLGTSNFTTNVLAKPFGLFVEPARGAQTAQKHSGKAVQWRLRETQRHSVLLSSVLHIDGVETISHDMEISVDANSRRIEVTLSGEVLADLSVRRLSYDLYLHSPSLYGLYDSGIVQMMGKTNECLGANTTLQRAYFLGGGSALDVVFSSDKVDTVFVSNTNSDDFLSALQYVVFGSYPRINDNLNHAWSKACWRDTPATSLQKGTKWSSALQLVPNNFNFPALLLADISETKMNMPFDQLQAYLTGIYGSPAGCLQSYYAAQGGVIAPTVSHPDVGYDPDTNFFDPDNFISLSALLYSGDVYMQTQVRLVLERTAQTMCGIGGDQDPRYCDLPRQRLAHSPYRSARFTHLHAAADEAASANAKYAASSRAGQLMHHFISLSPTYESIAGSEQLGPNIFWTWCALRYISISQDYAWAEQMFPFIDLSTKFILSFVDPAKDMLVDAPGPLWIDVLVREHYTSDSNAMMVPILQEIAKMYVYLDVDVDFAAELESIAQQITVGVNKYLWAATGDHLVTQLNRDGSTRDFVDYDSNLIAVAFNVIPNITDVAKVLQRVDNGSHTHIRATWCSEIPYSGDAEDCYIVGGDVCGDSVVTLARIGWVDALARKRVGDVSMVQNVLLQPLVDDLVRDTWLYERYDANGTQIRTAFYFEYPSLISIIIREVLYGIDISLNEVNINPIVYSEFEYLFGNTQVKYSRQSVYLQLPFLLSSPTTAAAVSRVKAVKSKVVHVYHMFPLQVYVVENACGSSRNKEEVTSDAAGKLTFSATFDHGCDVRITASSSSSSL